MKIVAVNRYYGADLAATAPLLADVAEQLVEDGCEVDVLTTRMRYDRPQQRLPKVEIRNGVRINRIWTTTFGRHWLPGRFVDYLSFYLSAFRVLLRNADADTIIIAKTDPPLISVVAWIAAKAKGAKLVNWCQDLFPEVAVACGVSFGNRVIGKVVRAIRNVSLRGANANVVLSEEMAGYLEAQDIPRDKLEVIANWPRPEMDEGGDVDTSALRAELGLEDEFVIGYSGNLGIAHATDSVVELLERTRELDDVAFLFTGGGRGAARLKALASERAWRHVRFRDYQPASALIRSLSLPDVHLITLAPRCERLVVPSKLYGVLAAGRSCLYLGAEDGHVARVLDELNAGQTLPIDRPDLWLDAIRKLSNNPELIASRNKSARRGYERFFHRSISLRAWSDLVSRQGREQRLSSETNPIPGEPADAETA